MHYDWPPEPEISITLAAGGDVAFYVGLSPDDYEQYKMRPNETLERLLKVPVGEIVAWEAAQGRPQCLATTGKGARCKNHVPGVVLRSPGAWHGYAGGYCVAHGAL